MRGGLILTDGYQTTAALRLEDPDLIDVRIGATTLAVNPSLLQGGVILSSTINSDSYNAGITLDSVTVRDSEFTLGCCGANFSISLARSTTVHSATTTTITRLR